MTEGISDRIGPDRRPRAAFVWLAALALGVTACRSGEGEARKEPGPAPVETAVVGVDDFAELVHGIGTVEAGETVELRAEQPGRLESVRFEEGTRVKEGSLLFTIDAQVLEQQRAAQRAALRGARARLREARRNVGRQRRLLRRDMTARASYDAARTEAQAAAAEVERLKSEIAALTERFEDTRIRAPFSGWISESLVDPGDFVTAGQPLATMYRTMDMRVTFAVPERLAPRVAVGQPVRIFVAGADEPTSTAKVSFVAPSVREDTRDVLIRAVLDRPEASLRPGQFVRAEVEVEQLEDRPFVPEESLVGTREGYVVFVIEDGTARMRRVEVGVRRPGRVEIREGLRPGEQVVTAGQLSIEDGSRVEVVREQGADEPPPEQAPPETEGEPPSAGREAAPPGAAVAASRGLAVPVPGLGAAGPAGSGEGAGAAGGARG